MRSTGIVRRIDDLGRIVIPKETRRVLGIKEGDSLEIFTEDENIILKKYQPGCVFCDDTKEIINFKGKMICKNCLKDIKR